jgi:hypothetical protein
MATKISWRAVRHDETFKMLTVLRLQYNVVLFVTAIIRTILNRYTVNRFGSGRLLIITARILRQDCLLDDLFCIIDAFCKYFNP